jgi:hypothetical protein
MPLLEFSFPDDDRPRRRYAPPPAPTAPTRDEIHQVEDYDS